MKNEILIAPEDRGEYRLALDFLKKAVRRGRIETVESIFVTSLIMGHLQNQDFNDSELINAAQDLDDAFMNFVSLLGDSNNDTKQSAT